MREGSEARLPLLTATLLAAIGAAWLVVTALLPQDRPVQVASAIAFIAIGAIAMYAIVLRGVTEQRRRLEELLDQEQRDIQRRQRLDILWRFAGSESADFDSHAKGALEVSARVLGLESAEVAHVEDDNLVYDLVLTRNSHEPPGDAVELHIALGSLPIEAEKTVAYEDVFGNVAVTEHSQIAKQGVRAYIGTPFLVGSTLYELGFWSTSSRSVPFDQEDYEYVQVLAGFFAGLFRQHKQEEEMAQLALFDPLTGLPNRTNLLDRLRASIAAHRRREAQCALLVVTLNRFKQVNDVVGHAAGDAALLEVTRRLTSVLRAEDSLARVGGDQFGVITSILRGPDEAVALAERPCHSEC